MSNVQNFPEELFRRMQSYGRGLPSPEETHEFVDSMIHFLFPMRNFKDARITHLCYEWERLRCLFVDILVSLETLLDESPEALAQCFFDAVPAIHEQLLEEADYFVQCDPAAKSKDEVMLCYPGYYAIVVYRLANELYRMKIPILPRAISEYANSKTGIEIHPGAVIGRHFYIDHGTGIVIGETAEIGNNVKIYQGVTLGAMYVEKSLQNTKRHPTIEDDVIIYAGSTILGGDTVVGRNTIIGGNVWLTESVAPNSIVYHKAEVVIRDQRR
ncbi:MAG: serine acetyltransferase [Bacteroidales bacterium]|jgi:serine O-acetyltransferase|nr:serine acetyltransferase [Bacteroidales bacterium]